MTIIRQNFGVLAGRSSLGETPPVPPLTATAQSSSAITLSWPQPATRHYQRVTAYTLERSPNGSTGWTTLYTGTNTTYPDSGLSASTTYYYRCSATNGTNASGYGSANATTSSSATTRKWNPGHYIKTQGTCSQPDQDGYFSSVLTTCQKSLDASYLLGNYVQFAWGAINTTGSTFSTARLDQVINWHVANNRRVIIDMTCKNFSTSAANAPLLAPTDLAAQVVTTSTGYMAALWRSTVMDRFIAAFQWLATYVDSHPNVEMIATLESSPSAPTPADYNKATYSTQTQRLYAAAQAAFTQTSFIASINSLSGQVTQLVNAAYNARCAFGSPDAVDTNGPRIFRGETVSGELAPSGDYRGQLAHHEIASSPVLGGKDNNGPPANVINWAQTNKVTHLSWITTAASPNSWADIKTAIVADPNLYLTYPTRY